MPPLRQAGVQVGMHDVGTEDRKIHQASIAVPVFHFIILRGAGEIFRQWDNFY